MKYPSEKRSAKSLKLIVPSPVQFLSQNYREKWQGMQHIRQKGLKEHFAGSFNSSMAKEDRDDLWNNLDVKSYMGFKSQKFNHKPTEQQSNCEKTDALCASKLRPWETRCPVGSSPSTPSVRPLLLSKGNPASLTCWATFQDHLALLFHDVHLYQLIYRWCCGANFDW